MHEKRAKGVVRGGFRGNSGPLRVAEDGNAGRTAGVGEMRVEFGVRCFVAPGAVRLAVLPASFRNRLHDGVAGDSVDSRIAKSPAGGFPLFVGILPPRWKHFCAFLAPGEFRDHSSPQGDGEFVVLLDSAQKLGGAGFGFGGADLDWGLGGHGLRACFEAGPRRLVYQPVG